MAKILLVDDHINQIISLQILLGLQGVDDVLVAECVEEALAIYEENPDIRLLVTDCRMPINKDGEHNPYAGKMLLDRMRLTGFGGVAALMSSDRNCDSPDFAHKFNKDGTGSGPDEIVDWCIKLLEVKPERRSELNMKRLES